MTMPAVVTQIAWDSGYTTPAASRTWTDLTAYVEAQDGISIERGRQDQFSNVQASKCSVTFDNRDGRFTPENAAGAYYPNVKKGRPLRVRAGVDGVIAFDTFSNADDVDVIWDASLGLGRTVPFGIGGLTWVGSDAVRDWGIIGNQAYQPAGGTHVTVDVGQSDVTVECDFTTGAALSDTGLSIRYVDDNNRISARVDSGGGGRWLIQKVVGGVVTGVGTGGTAAVSTSYALKVVCSGSSISLYVGGVLTVSATVADAVLLSATKFGLKGTGADYRWDNVVIRGIIYRDLFTGYVDEWPVQWPGGSDAMSTVTVTAMSRMARLGRTANFRSIVEEEILYDSPVLYWPLGEPEGSTTAGNIARGRTEILTATQMGTGGTLTFGAGIGPPTDDLTAPVFTPASSGNGLFLAAPMISPVTEAGDTVLDMECFIGSASDATIICRLNRDAAASPDGISLIGSVGSVGVSARVNGVTVQAVTAATVTDGALHHLSGRITLSGGNATASLILDGGSRVTGSGTAVGITEFPSYDWLFVGTALAVNSPDLIAGTLAHFAIFSGTSAVADARIQAHAAAGFAGFEGETSGTRIERYARLAGIPTVEIDAETGLSTSMAHKDTTGEQVIGAMEAVAETEDGVVFDAGDGTLTFHSRDHRYGSVSAFTLDCANGDIETGLEPTLDDQGMVNIMTASRPSGVTVTAYNQESIDGATGDFGEYRKSIEVLTTIDTEVQSRADWAVNRFGFPRVSVPNVEVDVVSCAAALQADLLVAEIGTRLTLDNLPSQAPASTMDFFVEGIRYSITDSTFKVGFNTSAANYANVWILDSASFSQLDSTTVLAY
jgi:hypothetical protein